MPAAVVCGGCAHRIGTAGIVPAPSALSRNFEREAVNAIDAGDGDYEAKVLRARLNADPQDLSARLELARHYWKAGFPEVAIEHCQLACERAPDSVEAHLALAKFLREEHRPAEAAQVLRSFAASHVGEVEIWAWLGVAADEANDWKGGEIAHRKAVALAPGRADLLNNLGYCLLEQNRKAEAEENFRAALAIDPRSLIARNNLGLALSDKPAAAVLNWQSAAGPAAAHNNMAVALIEAGKYAEARGEIQKALDYDSQHGAALHNLRLVSELDGKPAVMRRRQNKSGSPVASTKPSTKQGTD
jgi:Flp pilus assembly protein TadD